MWAIGKKKGFTLVELSLSIAFIAILSITVTLIITQSISTYRRGLTLNQINTVGMDLVDDIRSVIQNSPAKAVKGMCASVYSGDGTKVKNCEDENGINLVLTRKPGTVSEGVSDSGGNDIPVYGAFCSGSYSYIWQSGYFELNLVQNFSRDNIKLSYSMIENGNTVNRFRNNFKLLKVKDQDRSVCVSAAKEGFNGDFKLGALDGEIEELLGDNNLALYDFDIAVPATNDLNTASFYSVSFILGTIEGGININSTGNYCKTPESYSSSENFDYCSINKFNFAAQAIGG